MGEIISMSVNDALSPALRKTVKKTRNLSQVMRKVEQLIMKPLKSMAWQKSGLESRSGELEGAVQTWHGKKSAGVSVHTSPGRDLVIPKATMHTEGAKKGKYRRKQRYRVKTHSRRGKNVRRHERRNAGSPWGNVEARGFIPTGLSAADIQRAAKMIEDFIDV